jgi:DNA primase
MDAIACWQAGIKAFGIYGSHVGQRQAELVHKCSPTVVHLWFDNDAAGKLATEKAQELFEGLGLQTMPFPWKYHPLAKDPGELTPEQLMEVGRKVFV